MSLGTGVPKRQDQISVLVVISGRDVFTKTHINGALPVLFTLASSPPPISNEHQHDLANINESTTATLSTLRSPS